MGIFSSNNDETLKYLEQERVKLWTQVRILEDKSHANKEESRVLKEESSLLKDALNKKTSDYEAEAKQASKKTVEYKNKSELAKDTITQNLNQSHELLTAITIVHDSINTLNSQITDIVESAKLNHNDVVEAYNDIQSRKEAIEEQLTELEALFANHSTYSNNIKTLQDIATNGQETSTKIESLHKTLLSKKNEIDELYYQIIGYSDKNAETGVETQVSGLKHELEESYEELKSNLSKTQEELSEHKRKQLADSITFENDKESQYSNTLKKWGDEYSIVLDKIRSLLPEALTAGLSHAYELKKKQEITDSKDLTKKFMGGIIGMICVSLIPFAVSVYYYYTGKTLDEVIGTVPRLVVAILPLYIPVLWLAYSANKSLHLSKRLIEEYTHKEVLSKTYEGLSRQIENIDDDEISSDLRIRLLYNILEVNSENPGKLITDYNKADHPLMDALDKSVKLGNAVERLSEFPGMSRLASMMAKKARRIMNENMKKAEEGFDAVSENEEDDKEETVKA